MQKLRLPMFFYNRFFWQLILALFMLGTAIFFIQHEHLELFEIGNRFSELNPLYVVIGALLTLVYAGLQGAMYVYSFKSLGKQVTLKSSVFLFLKRNLVSVFLPAGGFASLAFFSRDIKNQGATTAQVHLSSVIYGICGILSVVVVGIPILFYALLLGKLQTTEIWGFSILVLLSVVLIVAFVSLVKKGWAFRLVVSRFSQLAIILNEFASNQISLKHFIRTLMISVLIEFVGIAHLYIAMLALGFTPSWPAALIGYVVMVVILIASPFLRGLGAIEVSMTFILGQYGFPIVAAASIILLFRLFEFWIPLLMGVVSFISKKDNLVLRVFPAMLLFVLGIVNIISAISPAIPSRLKFVESFLPRIFIDASNGLILISGLVLILLAVFLIQGSKRAWLIAVFMTIFSVFGHLVKAIDYEESILAALSFVVLFYTRNSYKLKAHPTFTRLSLKVTLLGLGAVLLYGVVGFYFIDKHHFGVDFILKDAVTTVLKLFFLLDDSGLTPLTRFARNFIYSIYGAGGIYVLFVLFGLLRTYFIKPYNSEEEKKKVVELAERYGKSALDFFKIYPDKLFFITDNQKAFISFRITRHIAVVLEDPVAENEYEMKSAIVAFDAYCSNNGLISVYFRVPETSLPIYESLKKKSFPVGEEAVLDLTTFSLDGHKIRPTRSAITRLTGEGFIFRVYEAPIKDGLLQKLALVSKQWLETMGQTEIAFTQGVFDPVILKNQTIMTIEDAEEKVYAFLNIVPVYARQLATYDLIRKVSDAPNGVLDMLLCKTFLYMKEQGFEQMNLGLAPMSGMEGVDFKEKAVKYAYENIRSFGHFKGLRKYKEKFFPQWDKRYLVYNHNYHLFQVPNALRKVSDPKVMKS